MTRWLILMFQLPARPTAARVRTWRQLQRLGAVFVRNSAYFLPWSEQAREDFEWLRADIGASGGEAMVVVAETASREAEGELLSAFRDQRRAAFEALRRDALAVGRSGKSRARDTRPAARVFADRLAALESTDYFGGVDRARDAARAAVSALQPKPGDHVMSTVSAARLKTTQFKGRTWVTRPRPGIDRFASAWLIARFIDPRARFAFASAPQPTRRQPPAVTFDMYGGDFGHEGGGCTFETLVARFALRAPGLEWLARLVHVLDLKEDVADIPEAPAVARLVEGLREMHADDRTLLDRGVEIIEALYRSRLQQESARPSTAVRRRRTRARQ
jgi:hypothetical protein